MNKFVGLFLLFPILALCQNNSLPKNYISMGLFDHKNGFSAISYSRSILKNKDHELFLGCGSMIMFNTLTIGYKGYFIKSFADGFYVASLQKIYEMAGGPNSVFLSVGIEKKIWKFLFINAGVNINYLLDDLELLAFPSLNINIRL